MGPTNGEILVLKRFIISLLFVVSLGVSAQQTSDTLKSLTSIEARMPLYRDGRLQVFIYSQKTIRHADRLELDYPVLDLIKRDVNVDSIKYIENYNPYDLDAPLQEILLYWAGMIHSDGVIMSHKAFIDTQEQLAYGKEKVFFRSPMLDLNGVGFRANFKDRNVNVESKVEIRIRTVDPKALEKDGKVEPTKATGDSLFIDFESEMAILTGNVVVNESQFHLTCDRIEIDMKKSDDKPKDKDKEKQEITRESLMGSNLGVSRITCIGNVRITRKLSEEERKEGDQTVNSEKAVYEVASGQITLSGGKPVMRRGADSLAAAEITIWRESERLRGNRDCEIIVQRKSDTGEKLPPTIINSEFLDMDMAKNSGNLSGNVRINDQGTRLNCHQMALTFADVKPENAGDNKKMGTDLFKMAGDKEAAGKKDLTWIRCSGDVIVVRDGEKDKDGKVSPPSRATAGQMDYDIRKNILVMTKDKPTLKRGEDSIAGDKITVWVDEKKMEVEHNSEIQLIAKGGDAATPNRSIIRSDFSDLDYGKDKLVFRDAVRVRDKRLNLDCGVMTIYLAEDPNAPKKEPQKKNGDVLNDNPLDGSKEVDKIICQKDVVVDDEKGILTCDQLTVYFEPKAPGKETPKSTDRETGLGNREVEKLVSEGNVHFVGKNAKDNGPQETVAGTGGKIKQGTFSDQSHIFADYGEVEMKKNFGFFQGNVKMLDPQGGLRCNKMDFYLKDFKEVVPVKPARVVPRDSDAITLPKQISLGFGKELEKIICLDNVRLVRVTPQEKSGAVGTRGEYIVADKRLKMTGTPAKRVQLIRNDIKTEHDIVYYWPESGKMSGSKGYVREGSVQPGN